MNSSFSNRIILSLTVGLFFVSPLTMNSRPFCFAFVGRGFVRFSRMPHSPSRYFSHLDDLMSDVENLIGQREPNNSTTVDSKMNEGWVRLGFKDLEVRETPPSLVEEKIIQGRRVFIKRDDLIRLHGSQISGNKARKMKAINEIPAQDFPGCLVSFGGPQSNSMLALAALVNYKNREMEERKKIDDSSELSKDSIVDSHETKRFVYYTKKLPRFLRTQPSGNLFRAMTLGMEIKELSYQEYGDLFGSDFGGSPDPPMGLSAPVFGESLWVPQGGAFGMAALGASILATELLSFWSEKGDDRPLSVCLPGGTCSTAVLLHHELKKLKKNSSHPLDIEIVVIPCVGDAAYARRQMMALSAEIGASVDDVPSILQPAPMDPNTRSKTNKYFSFGQPHKSILRVFKTMKDDHEVVLDLLYGAPAWTILLKHWNVTLGPDIDFDPNNPIAGRELLYLHSGGLEGINSQLLRYKHKGLVSNKEIQFPGKRNKRPS